MDKILVKRTLIETTETENYLSSDHNNCKNSVSLQAETSKKPTAVDTAPRHPVRKNLSVA